MKQRSWLRVFSILLIVILCIGCSNSSKKSNSYANTAEQKTNTCKICGRSWSAGDSGGNYKKIASSGMCVNCYNNYQTGQDIIGKSSTGSNSSSSSSSTQKKSSKSSSNKCQFVDIYGNESCTNEAMPGGTLCKYHFDYLDDAYKSITGGSSSKSSSSSSYGSSSKKTCPSCGKNVSSLVTKKDAMGNTNSWCSSCWSEYWDIMKAAGY